MRFFRIPAFTGIETHRDDADRGSLRTVEGCIPHGPGGLRSSPVWSTLGTVSQVSTDDQNKASAIDDSSGTSLLFASRNNEVHDVAMIHAVNSVTLSLGHHDYDVINQALFTDAKAYYAPVGNKLYAFGDGSDTAVMVGKGPWFKGSHVANRGPDKVLYTQEWSDFPQCQFFVAGPKKTIFASGNPEDPLAVYISEPAGQMQPFKNAPYSTESNTESPGLDSDQQYHPLEQAHASYNPPYADGLSMVRILGSNATRVTALSTRGDKIVVHTDAGCHILFAPSADQADTGYRVEQVAATNTSSAINSQVVAGDGGTQPFWFGFDGQVYKDSAAARGAEDFKSYSDPQQASWKSKGKWEREHPNNLENSFATYDPQSGMYWVFVESAESTLSVRDPLHGPTVFSAAQLMHSNPPAGGPTALSLITAPVNGPTALSLITAPVNGPTGFAAIEITGPPAYGPTGLVTGPPANGPILLGTSILGPPYNGPRFLVTEETPASNPPANGPTAFQASQYAIPNPSIYADSNNVSMPEGGVYTVHVLAEFGTLFSRGQGDAGQLGNNSTADSYSFVQTSSSTGVQHISAGPFTCTWIESSGEMWATGSNTFGQKGLGMSWEINEYDPYNFTHLTPHRVSPDYANWESSNAYSDPFLTTYQTMLSCAQGEYGGLHVASDGRLYHYGLNHATFKGYPHQMTDYFHQSDFERQWTDPVKICRGAWKSWFFIDDDGYLLSYGENANGQLGRDPSEMVNWPQWSFDKVPKKTPIYDVVDVISAAGSTYFIKSDGTLWMVGAMNGNSHVPTQIDSNVSYAAAGGGVGRLGHGKGNLLYRKTDATLWGMGTNTYGSLGLGHGNEVTTAQQIDTDVLGMDTNGFTTTYLKWKTGSTLAVWQMGINNNRVMGNGISDGAYIQTPQETGTVTD